MAISQVHIEIGAIVREYRELRGKTQMDLAAVLGYDSPQFVSLFERGLSKIPLETLGTLMFMLDIPEQKIKKLLMKDYETELANRISSGRKNGAKLAGKAV